ncbi:glycosyltransferase family 4 protein [bacterium]|nr:glycosyltransferase family 4 protein [bacterium]
MKVLLLVYACEPNAGSEPGTGWNTALHLAKSHQVTVVTRSNNQGRIESALRELTGPVPEFVYYDLPPVLVSLKKKLLGIHLYYALWQLGLSRVLTSLVDSKGFDIVHHLTFNSFEVPPFALRGIRARKVWGPVGGGQTAPQALLHSLSWKSRIKEKLRSLRVVLSTWNPLVRSLFREADAVLFANQETRSRFQNLCRRDAGLMIDVGVDADVFQPVDRTGREQANLLFAGRLESRKGARLLLFSFKEALRDIPGMRLTVVGSGPERIELENLEVELGLTGKIDWVGKVSHGKMRDSLAAADLFVFPSLRDTSGTIVLEAMACGLPVICFDHQGGKIMIGDEAGLKVDANSSLKVAIAQWATAMTSLLKNRRSDELFGQHGPKRVRNHFTWEKKVKRIEALYRSLDSE